ncbi:MAG: hypothetical protein DRP97_02265 [Candidatus Latescibacterota bacterium]|nr:MAG: hypothetical protein DRP97_02265 [Candidatus Latescibacterota bacterium]
MITKTAVIDGLEHTFIQPILNKVRDDISRKIIQDADAFNHNIGNYENEGVELGDNVYDNTIGGPLLYYTHEVTEDEGMQLGTSTYHPLNKIILLDKDNGFNLRPNYKAITITITFTYKTQSKTMAHRVLNRLKTYYDNSGYTMAHNVPYSYLLPNNILSLINDIKSLKDDAMELNNYIASISKFKLDLTIKRNSNYKVPVFRGNFNNIFGLFESIPNDIDIVKQDDAYFDVEFTYKISVKEPISLSVQYPVMVNNKALPDIWIPTKFIGKAIGNAENVININNIIGNYESLKDNSLAMVHVPTYDNFYPLRYDNGTLIRLVSILLEVDVNDPTLIFNVNDLRFIGLPILVIDFLNECDADELFIFSRCILNIELFENGDKKDYGLFKDSNGNIKTTVPLKKEASYHFIINVVNDRGYIKHYSPTNPDEVKVARDNSLIYVYRLPVKEIWNNTIGVKIS